MITIYETATGRLHSVCYAQSEVADPLPAGMSQKTVADPPQGHVWSTGTLDFVAPTPPRVRSKTAWVNQFTLAELRALLTAQVGLTGTNRVNVMTFERYLSILGDTIDLDDSAVTAGLDAMVAAGIIDAARRTAMLT